MRYALEKELEPVGRDFIRLIRMELRKFKRVAVPGLGVFEVRVRKARDIVNFEGQRIRLPAMKEVRFRAAKALREAL